MPSESAGSSGCRSGTRQCRRVRGFLADVVALAQTGNKIEAIKRYRELTGVGLREAKDVVDGI